MSSKIVCENCYAEVYDRFVSPASRGWWDLGTGEYGENRKRFDICSNECLKEWVAGLPPIFGGVVGE